MNSIALLLLFSISKSALASPPQPQPQADPRPASGAKTYYNAIAYSQLTGHGTTSYCQWTDTAESDALEGCQEQGPSDCRIVVSVQNIYVAIAAVTGKPLPFGVGWGSTAKNAKNMALKNCHDPKCEIQDSSPSCPIASHGSALTSNSSDGIGSTNEVVNPQRGGSYPGRDGDCYPPTGILPQH